MAYCRECGKEINDKAVICPNCGCATGVKGLPTDKDNGVLGWFVLSFILSCVGAVIGGLLWGIILSLVGIVLGLIWKDSRPYCSKACLKGSLCGIVFTAIFIIFRLFLLNL